MQPILIALAAHGDDDRGLGATHQTGWTSLVVRCLETCLACALDTVARKTQEERERAAEPSRRSPS